MKAYLVHCGSMAFACLIRAQEHIASVFISVVGDHNNDLLVGQGEGLEMATHNSGPVHNGFSCPERERD